MKTFTYIIDDFVDRSYGEVRAYLDTRAEQGFKLVSVIRFTNQHGIIERYFWRIKKKNV